MTHYWWMHWFWITTAITNVILCDSSSTTTIHSSYTETPATQDTTNARNAKSIENSLNIPPIIDTSSFNKNTSHNVTTKHLKPSWTTTTTTTPTTSNTTTEMTVINQNNTTDTSLNVTDNQIISTALNILNSSIENVTFGDDFNYNNTFVQNSERIGVEMDDVNGNNLSAAGITGITLGCVVIVGVICGISYFIYHNRGFNRPQVLNDRCSNPDSSGYIDDASVRDNSEEMYSLDNDSFLNSLEAMTIQNYWTDTVKHTKL